MITSSLTDADRRSFVRDGLIVRRAMLPPDRVTKAARLVSEGLSAPLGGERLLRYTETTFAPELGSDSSLLALLRDTDAATCAVDLLHPAGFEPVTKVQIQVRVPDRALATPQPVKQMHVDGVACPHLDAQELRTFTLLVGVFLTPVINRDAGALRVVRGGHVDMARWFRGAWSPGCADQAPDEISGQDGEAITGAPGDVLFMHHAVPHAVGANLTNSPRIMLYFRLKYVGHDEQVIPALHDPWLEYPSLRPFASR